MIISILYTIQMMGHSERASFGDSSATYGVNTLKILPRGIIQGNGVPPLIRAEISTFLFLILKEKCMVDHFARQLPRY